MIHYWNLCFMYNHKFNIYAAKNLSVTQSNSNNFQANFLKLRYSHYYNNSYEKIVYSN